MAEIIGNIATAPEKRIAQGSQETYFTFRLAENSGRGDSRRTTWYDVRAKIDEEKASQLRSGDLVRIRGRIEPQAFLKKKMLASVPLPQNWDAVAKLLRDRGALGSGVVLMTSSVEPHEFPPRDQQIDE